MGWHPIMIPGMLRDMLTKHFATPLQIEEPDLRALVWRPDERTGILIESLWRWRGELANKRPAVLIKDNAQQNVRKLIGDIHGPTEQGHMQYLTFWVGSHTLFCLHGSGAGAKILATEVQRELTQFGPRIIADLMLQNFQVTELGGTAILRESRDTFVVPVTVAWAYQEKWRLEQESLKLRKVPLGVLLDGALVQETK